MTVLWWAISILLMLAGLVGTVVPLLPGTVLILAGAVFHRLMLGAEHSVDWWTLGALTVLMVIGQVMDFISGGLGAKWFGATRWGAIGGILGAVVGIFFGFVGLFVGPLIGALLGELLGGKGLLPAGKSGVGSVVGTVAGMASKIAIGVVMIVWFVVALLWS